MCDREKELFLLDIIVAIEKIKFIADKFNNAEDLKYDLPFVKEKLEKLKNEPK